MKVEHWDQRCPPVIYKHTMWPPEQIDLLPEFEAIFWANIEELFA